MTTTSVGEELRALREARKLKRPQVEVATGIPAGRISRIETGTEPKPDELERLRAFYENGEAAASPAMTKSAEDAAKDEAPSTGVTAPRRSDRKLQPGPLPPMAWLRFTDGAVVDPSICPKQIHARSHFIWDPVTSTATCRCVATSVEPPLDTEEDEES